MWITGARVENKERKIREKKKAAKTQGEKREIFVFTDYWNDHIIKPTKVEWQRVCVSEWGWWLSDEKCKAVARKKKHFKLRRSETFPRLDSKENQK